MPFKICVVGCGHLSNTQHGPAILKYIEQNEGVVFAACCDIDEQKAREYKDKFKLSGYYTDFIEMLDTEKPDAVSLICPENKTAELSCRIMERGYPLLLEKPPGLNGGETQRMMEVAEKYGTPNQVAFNRRYIPLVQKMMEILGDSSDKGGKTEIMDICYRMIRVNRRDTDFATTAIHGIDLVKFIAGSNYKQVDFRFNELPQYGKNVANIHIDGIMDSGTVIHMDFLPMSGVVTERLEVNTHKGLFRLELPVWAYGEDVTGRITQIIDSEIVFTMTGVEMAGSEMVSSDEEFMINGFYNENKSFLDDIRKGIKPEGDIASGLQAVEIADHINDRRARYE